MPKLERNLVDSKRHWEEIFSTKTVQEMSWTQECATQSLELIALAKIGSSSQIIDVGSGESVLIKELLGLGFRNLTVLDISEAAISKAKETFGTSESSINWVVSDVLAANLKKEFFDLWHDRAVFHFLTEKKQRDLYVAKLEASLRPGGFAIIATFSLSGPEKCSGLPVLRYDAKSLQAELGHNFRLIKSTPESHSTPWGKEQNFLYCLFKKNGE